MSKFESIDDFLSNRLGEQEKAAFEQEAASDPSLKADLDLQNEIIEGVRKARIAELKAMLNNVPVGGMSGGGLAAIKTAATIFTAALIGTGIYFALHESKTAPPPKESVAVAPEKKNDDKFSTEKVAGSDQGQAKSAPAASQSSATKEKISSNTAEAAKAKGEIQSQPKIEVVDPSEDMIDSNRGSTKTDASHRTTTASRIAVDTDPSNKKYNFNYQFAGNKLILFGPFDKSLYEILEINGDQKSVFLFYKDNYYLLSDQQHTIAPLEPIKDIQLIKKLREYRGNSSLK